MLVHLCERLGDKAKLQEYMTKFATQGFSDFLFKQYLDKGKLKKLLSFSEDFPRELSAFLSPHDSLSWLHHTATKEYGKVCGLCHLCVPYYGTTSCVGYGFVVTLYFRHMKLWNCLLYTSPSPRDATLSRMPSSA